MVELFLRPRIKPHTKPQTESLVARFYKGMNYERTLRVYLHLNGAAPNAKSIPIVACSINRYKRKTVDLNGWNRLHQLLVDLNMLRIMQSRSGTQTYEWVTENLPTNFERALFEVRNGAAIEKIVLKYCSFT
ncbi:MAG: hypothetical protein NTX72_00060 [Candidatus Uhrbacteria bacterium]|nr:hypothetical protein [Candidatus Uhrbacteria bacterium]